MYIYIPTIVTKMFTILTFERILVLRENILSFWSRLKRDKQDKNGKEA